MLECCPTSRTARFWKLAHHHVQGDTSKLWRSNAEPLILKLCPCDFDIGQLDSGCLLHTLELAWTLRQNETCQKFIQATLTSFLLSAQTSNLRLKQNTTFTFTVLKMMAHEGGGFVETQAIFEFCAACYTASTALQSMAVAAWCTRCTSVDLGSLFMTSHCGLELLVQTPVSKVSSWCRVNINLIDASFRVGCSKIITGCIKNVPQATKLELETIQSTWFMLVVLSCNTHLITEEGLEMASSIVALYFDKDTDLHPSLEHLRLDLTGKSLEKLVFPSLAVLQHSPVHVPIDLDSDSWHWIQHRPKVFQAFAEYIITSPSADIAALSKSFGQHKMWWDILSCYFAGSSGSDSEKHVEVALEYVPKSLDFFWKLSSEDLIRRIPIEMLVDYLVEKDVSLDEGSRIRQALKTDKLSLDSPSEGLLRFLAKNRIELSDCSKERLLRFIDDISINDRHLFRKLAPLFLELGLVSVAVRVVACEEDSLLDALVDDDLYSALMESIDHDHTNVVGYRSCTAECYCD